MVLVIALEGKPDVSGAEVGDLRIVVVPATAPLLFLRPFFRPFPGRRFSIKGPIKSSIKQEQPRRQAVADDLYAAMVGRQIVDMVILGGIKAVAMEQQLGKFVEQGENLPRLGRRIVDLDDRKFFVVEAESRISVIAKLVFEDVDANMKEGLPPLVQGGLRIAPALLLFQGNAEIFPHLGGDWSMSSLGWNERPLVTSRRARLRPKFSSSSPS